MLGHTLTQIYEKMMRSALTCGSEPELQKPTLSVEDFAMTKSDSSRVPSRVGSEQNKCQARKAKLFPIKIIKITDKKTSVEMNFM